MELPKGVSLLIFDFDGTLFYLDDMDWDSMRAQLDLQEGENLGQAMQRLHLSEPAKLNVITKAELQAVGERRLSAEIAAALQQLAQNHRIAILTRNSRRAVERALEGTPLAPLIYIVGREDVQHLKPHPEGAHIIMAEFEAQPADALWVGDTYHDVEAAKAAGITVAVVANPRLAYAPEGADHYIAAIADLPALLRA